MYVVNKYFTKEDCSEILDFCMKNGEMFSYNPNESWDCRRIYVDEFKEKIVTKFKNLHLNGDTKYWFNFNEFDIKNVNISLTRYYDGRFLNLHKDSTSQFTTVIVLTEDFEDGRFVISNKQGEDIKDMVEDSIKLNVELGHGISFDGSKIFHGVMPVHSGIRCALNVWMTNEDIEYSKLKNVKTLI